MTLTELTKGQAQEIVKWFDDPVCTGLVMPLLAGEQDNTARAALAALRAGDTAEAAHLGGVVDGYTRLAALHDQALQIVESEPE